MVFMMENDSSIAFYEGEVPAFARIELERLYGDVFSFLPYLVINGEITPQTNTYVRRNNGAIVTIFLFRRIRHHVKVINKGMRLTEEELRIFCEFIFTRFNAVNVIFFESIEAEIAQFPFPHQRHGCPAEIIIDLPATQQEYFAALGAGTRKNIKRKITRLMSDHPSFHMDFYEGDKIKEVQLQKIIDLNKARMDCLKKVYVRGAEEIKKVIGLSRTCGLIGVAMIADRVCGGNIGYLIGNTYVSHIGSHDSKYDKYSLGMISIYLTICECIVRGCRRFNFGTGNNPYKNWFGGAPRYLERVSIYRSRAQFFLNPQHAFQMGCGKWIYRLRLWVQMKLGTIRKSKVEGKLDAHSKILFFVLDELRTLKDHASKFMRRN